MPLLWLGRLLAIARRWLAWRREPAIAIERRPGPGGIEVAVLRVRRGPRSLHELATRIDLGDWATSAPGRELVLVRRVRLRGRAALE